ncbi:MAG TPA: peptide deformylase [Phycisphaerales bacterium]|nr:peptide deformylase [Phycisphaerales bacterium]
MPIDPSTLRVVHYPAPILRAKAQPVHEVTDEVRAVARRMIELMREEEGIGLAAPQVGLPWRLFVVHVPPNDERSPGDDPPTATDAPLVCINPKLTDPSRDLEPFEEGCLSLPDIRGEVRRPTQITLTATGLDGTPFTLRAGGLLARCFQHENDHLDGVLILDRMTQPSKMKNRLAVRELEEGAELL